MTFAHRPGLIDTLVWFGLALLVVAAILADCAQAARRAGIGKGD